MIGKNFFIFSILILVVSITPVTAVEISHNYSINHTNNTDSLITSINEDTSKIQSTTDEINNNKNIIEDDLNYIQSNWYKFWKYGTIIDKLNDITDKSKELSNKASELNQTASRMQDTSKQLEENLNENETHENPNDRKDAEHIISTLNQRLSTVISISNITNLTEGDIIQYKSQNKYYHYLKYVKTENNSVILEGSKNKLITVSNEEFKNGSTYKLNMDTPYNNSQIINEAYKIQHDELTDKIVKKNSEKSPYTSLTIAGIAITGCGAVLFTTGAIIIVIFTVATCFTAGAAVEGIMAGIKIGFLGIVIGGIGAGLLSSGLYIWHCLNEELNDLNYNLNDLELYNDGTNHAPVAQDLNLTTNGTSLNGTFNATDIDGDKLNFTVINQPQHGTLVLESDGNFTYTANNDSNGTDYFTYVANDGQLSSNNATVTLNTHIPPVANNMNITTRPGKNINSIFNVTDLYASKLNYTILSNPEHGTLNYTSNGSFIYLPYSNYTGNDNFTYIVNDGFFNSKLGVVNIVVTPNNPPIANNMTVTTKKGKGVSTLFNIRDIDGDKLTIMIVTPPTHGTVKLTNDKFVYTPSPNFVGKDFFTYLCNDGFSNSVTAKVIIDVRKG